MEDKTASLSYTSTHAAADLRQSPTPRCSPNEAHTPMTPHGHGLGCRGLTRKKWHPQSISLPTNTRKEQRGHPRPTNPRALEWGLDAHLGASRRRAVMVLAPWPWPSPGRMAQGMPGGWQVHARQRAGWGPRSSGARRAACRWARLRLCILPRSRQLGIRFLSST